jgi:hypothetical protein
MKRFVFVSLIIGLLFIIYQISFAVDDPTILWYKFDKDFKNEVEDSSAFKHNGMVTGNVEFDKSGKIGGAARFKGGSIKVPITDELNPEQSLTIEFWVRPDKVPASTYWRLIHKGWVAIGSYICGIDNNWMAMGYTWDVNNMNNVRTDANMANAVQNETWSYYTGTYDGKNIILYIDGKELVRTPTNGKINGSYEIVISEGFMGMMDEIRFSNVALQPDEIAKHMAGQTIKAVDPKSKLATTWSTVKSNI